MFTKTRIIGSTALALLLSAAPAAASVERAQAAQARGDLRGAQIELRNAVRTNPADAALRVLLANASIDVGDSDTAEKETRAALELGFDRVAGMALLARAYLVTQRFQELLRGMPAPDGATPTPVAVQVLAARATAYLGLKQQDAARGAAEEAKRLTPEAVATNLALAAVAMAAGDRATAEGAIDHALQTDPNNSEALMHKGAVLFERGEAGAAAELFGQILKRSPTHLQARLARSESLSRQGDAAGAMTDVDAALRSYPNSVPAIYMKARLLAQGGDARAVDELLQRIATFLPNLRDGLLLQASVKRSLGQKEQATDAARRFVTRSPEDPRGVKLLAAMELETGRFEPAVAVLTRFPLETAGDTEIYDLLGRAYVGLNRPRDAERAFVQAAKLSPDNPVIQGRLAAARLAIGDTAGMVAAANETLRIAPEGPAARQMLAIAAVSQGDLAAGEAELAKLDPTVRVGEIGQVLDGAIRIIRLDLAGARTAFEAALRANPNSVAARLGLARTAGAQGKPEEAERLLGEVVRRDPGNVEAGRRLSVMALSGGPRAAAARAVLENGLADLPGNVELMLVLANVLVRLGEAERAAALLDAEMQRNPRQDARVPKLLAEARAAQGDYEKAEAAARAALAADPKSSDVRRQLAVVVSRRGDQRGAEFIIEEGLRAQPGDQMLQSALVQLTRQTSGLDAALAMADKVAQRPGAMPQAAVLRGDLLLGSERIDDAARAYAAANKATPTSALALRLSNTLVMLKKPADATATLDAALAREPDNVALISTRGRLDLQAGRDADAERHFTRAVERAPTDVVSLNNLAWLLQKKQDPAALQRAGVLAERAYFLAPTAEVADTLGWVRVRSGNAANGVPLLRQAVRASAAGHGAADPAMSYRLAEGLRAIGARDEALLVLEPPMAARADFPERAAAERLLAALRAGR